MLYSEGETELFVTFNYILLCSIGTTNKLKRQNKLQEYFLFCASLVLLHLFVVIFDLIQVQVCSIIVRDENLVDTFLLFLLV